jgi:hypothetical protein
MPCCSPVSFQNHDLAFAAHISDHRLATLIHVHMLDTVINGDKLHTGIHLGGDKCQIAREAVQFGNHKLRPKLLARREGRQELLNCFIARSNDRT